MVRANNIRAMEEFTTHDENYAKKGGGGSFPCFLCEIKGLGLSALFVSFEGKKEF